MRKKNFLKIYLFLFIIIQFNYLCKQFSGTLNYVIVLVVFNISEVLFTNYVYENKHH